MNLKLIITDALQFFRYHVVQIATLCLPWLLAIALVEYLVFIIGVPSPSAVPERNPLGLIGIGFNLLVYPIYTGALILLMEKRARHETPNNRELLAASIQIWQPLFILNVIIAGIFYSALIFALQGWVLFLFPALFAAVRLAFSEFYLVLERVKPFEAIRMSFKATQPYFFQILLLLALFMMPFGLLELLTNQYFAKSGIGPLTNILSNTAIDLLSLFLDVLMFRAYMDVRQENRT